MAQDSSPDEFQLLAQGSVNPCGAIVSLFLPATFSGCLEPRRETPQVKTWASLDEVKQICFSPSGFQSLYKFVSSTVGPRSIQTAGNRKQWPYFTH